MYSIFSKKKIEKTGISVKMELFYEMNITFQIIRLLGEISCCDSMEDNCKN